VIEMAAKAWGVELRTDPSIWRPVNLKAKPLLCTDQLATAVKTHAVPALM